MAELEELFGLVNNLFDKLPQKPEMPAILLAYAAQQNQGMSSAKVASNIIAKMAEAGLVTTPMPSGASNKMDKLVEIMVDEIFHELTHNARIEVGSQIGSVTITGEGANAGGPVVVTGRNITPNKSYGIIQ